MYVMRGSIIEIGIRLESETRTCPLCEPGKPPGQGEDRMEREEGHGPDMATVHPPHLPANLCFFLNPLDILNTNMNVNIENFGMHYLF